MVRIVRWMILFVLFFVIFFETFNLVRIFIILGITWVFGIIGIMGTSEDKLPLSFDDDDKDNIGEMGTRVSLYHLIDNNDQ